MHIYRYVTESTFDAYLWQTVENKQKFTSQIMTSKSPVRSCEDCLLYTSATKEASSRSSVACAQAIDDFFSGRTPKFVVPELRDLIQK